MQRAGRVVVLNGSSSAGKTSLARELQRVWADRGEPWVIFGWDDFVPRLPDRWGAIPGMVGDLSVEGHRYVETGDDTAIVELGPLGQQMLRAYHRAVAAVARTGIDVIVDEVMMTADEWVDWGDALEGLDVRWIAVRCDPDVAAMRERERGDRLPGLARGTGLVVHDHATYDADVDTTGMSTADAAAQVDALLHRQP
ncbi:MAG TPA: hypothetical protein VM030_05115 [Acidimicrobiales bacterium]|nr:hypothetical protein [Acidimicrobiales bacterium]